MTEGISQRKELLDALQKAGMTANEFTDRSGKAYVVVPLIDTNLEPMINATEDPELRSYFRRAAQEWPHRAYLFICSGGPTPPWKIGVIGHNGLTNEDYSPDEWKTAATTEQAVEEFKGLWDNRDALLNAFIGDLDH